MAWRRSGFRNTVVVEGYILALKGDEAEEGSDTEENQEELQFLDLSEMINVSHGASSIKASSVARRFVTIKDLASDVIYKVFGRFHFTAPWWKVTAKIFCHQKKWYLQSYPSYSLRRHLGHQRMEIFSLFLTACHVHEQHIQFFIDFLSDSCNLEFSNLWMTLQWLANEKKDTKEQGFAESIIRGINSSVEGQYVQKALKFQNLMEYLPLLLPRHFLHILSPKEDKENVSEHLTISTLEKLEQMICTEVWKLGFSLILLKELQLIGCEASLLAFEEADLLRTIPELQQHALVIYDTLKQTCWSKGHTYVQVDELTGLRTSKFSVESAWESLKFLKDYKIIVIEKKRVFLTRFYNYEKEIANCIEELVERPPWRISVIVEEVLRKAFTPIQKERLPEDTEAGETEYSEDVDLDPDQVKAAAMMCENPVTIISGKGGCGKTTLVSLIFKAAVENMESADNEELLQACRDLERDQCAPESWDIPSSKTPDVACVEKDGVKKESVLFTAPTGKAASLLKKKTGFGAYTLHQVTWSFWSSEKARKAGAPLDWMFSEVQVLIVDEGSLVSVQILSTVLKLLMRHANLKKLIILGDVRQLPSIEPGNMFSDVYSSLYRIRWGIELATNHRAESQLIIDNAAKIAEMGLKSTYKELQYDAVMHISKGIDVSIPTPDKRFILVSLQPEYNPCVLQQAIKSLLKKAPGLDNDRTSQFIAFRRTDCALINELCCQQYSGHPTRNHKNKTEFLVRDKVCCTKNGYVRDYTEESESESKLKSKSEREKEKRVRLCNGEIFFICQNKIEETNVAKTHYLLLDDMENRQILVDYKEVMRVCKLQYAWARTIHTFQGSEADTVVYVVGLVGRQNWQHIYTAVTRGCQRVYVVTSENHFIKAVTAKSPRRNTRLRELLQEKLLKAGPTSGIEESLSQQQPSCMPSGVPFTLAVPNSTQFDSSVPSSQTVGDFASRKASEIKKESSNTESQKEDSFSEDLAFAQNYSWSPQSLEFDNRECDEAQESTTAACTSSLQTSDRTKMDSSVGKTEESTSSNRLSTPWSPGNKRIGNTVDEKGSSPKYSKVLLMESPLGCTKFKQLALDHSPPRGKMNAKQLFKEEK
ncbi:DNA helicase B [Heptranchias perlo]|uniref:DNA helicase B n=1 Tax=Heptranchias perlo TaxID=212740 RepID=UPI0035598C53